MSTIINLYDFLSKKKIIHSETATNYNDGITFFIESNIKLYADAITYNSSRQFLINNISIFEVDDKGNYFYEFSVDRYGDIIDNIFLEKSPYLKAELTYYIDGDKCLPEEIKYFVTCVSLYSGFKIRITFLEKPNLHDELKIIMRNYLLNTEDIQLLLHLCTFKTPI